MTHRLLNLATAMSLVLCVAVALLWVRGRTRGDAIWVSVDHRNVGAYLNQGCLLLESDNCPVGSEPPLWPTFDSRTEPVTFESFSATIGGAGEWSIRGLGFAVGRFVAGSYPVISEAVVLPYWFLLLLFAAPPTWRCRGLVTRARRAPGSCVYCGYDLRATRGSCPECGTGRVRP